MRNTIKIILIYSLVILFISGIALALEKLQDKTGAVINPATSDNQTNGNQKTQVTSAPTVTVNVNSAGAIATQATLSTMNGKFLSIFPTYGLDTPISPAATTNFNMAFYSATSKWNPLFAQYPYATKTGTLPHLDTNAQLYAYSGGTYYLLPGDGTDGLVVASSPRKTASATVSAVTVTSIAATILNANANRKGVIISNESTTVYIKLGVTPTLTSWTKKLTADGTWEMLETGYTGTISAIRSAVTGSLYVTEW